MNKTLTSIIAGAALLSSGCRDAPEPEVTQPVTPPVREAPAPAPQTGPRLVPHTVTEGQSVYRLVRGTGLFQTEQDVYFAVRDVCENLGRAFEPSEPNGGSCGLVYAGDVVYLPTRR